MVALLFWASMWLYVQRVLVPYQLAEAEQHANPRGNLSDLYPRWLGARELLLHHRDPYSSEVTRDIQTGYYGRPLDPERAGDPRDQQGFAYPVYVTFLLAPTVRLSFPETQMIFRWLLFLLSAASVVLWLRVLRWRPQPTVVAALLALTLGSFAVVQGVKLQQLSLLVAGLLALAVALLSSGQLAAAGAVLALATIKPQLALPVTCWLLLWTFSRWHERKKFVVGFGFTMVILLAGSEFILPHWIGKFLEGLSAYRQYTGGAASGLDFLLGPTAGRILACILLVAVIYYCWNARHADASERGFGVATALVLAATVNAMPTMTAPYNQLVLLPGVFVALMVLPKLWRASIMARSLYVIAAALLFWPWIAAFALVLLSVWLPVRWGWDVPLYTSFWVPVGVLSLVLLSARSVMTSGDQNDA